jgi:hypothetical protein
MHVLILGPDHPDWSLPPYLDILAEGLRQHGVTVDRHGSRAIPYDQETQQFWPLDRVIAEARSILDGVEFGDYDVVSLHFGNLEVDQHLPALWADRSLPPVVHHVHTLDSTLFLDHIRSPQCKSAVEQGLRVADGNIYFGQYAREHSSGSQGEPTAADIVRTAGARSNLFSTETHAARCLQTYRQMARRPARSRT